MELQRFVCMEGAFGGREKASFEFDCDAMWPDRKDWTPLLCVVTNNSPFLGFFSKYTMPAMATTTADFQTFLSDKTEFTYEETERRNSFATSSVTGKKVYFFKSISFNQTCIYIEQKHF